MNPCEQFTQDMNSITVWWNWSKHTAEDIAECDRRIAEAQKRRNEALSELNEQKGQA